MKKEIKNNLAILSYHEKRIQLEHEVQQRFENLGEDAQLVVHDVIREFIRRSALPVRIIYAQKHVEDMANTLAEKTQALYKLTETHERTVNEHNSQLSAKWGIGYEAGVRDATSKQQAVELKAESEKIQQLRLQLSTRESDLDQKTLELSEANQKLLDQAKRHQARTSELKEQLAEQAKLLIPMTGISNAHNGLIVKNWRTSWKWLSNWMFILIGYISVYGVPPEILTLVPEASLGKVTAILALIGFVCRFINQNKYLELTPAPVEKEGA